MNHKWSASTCLRNQKFRKYLLPIDSALTQFSSIQLTNEQAQKLYYGQVVETEEKAISLIKLINGSGEFLVRADPSRWIVDKREICYHVIQRDDAAKFK